VFAFALLATGAYLAFDVLDLDGSEMRARPLAATATAEPPRIESDLEHRPGVVPGAAVPQALARADGTTSHSAVGSSRRAAAATVWRGYALPRRHVTGDADRAPAPSADPA
jgi:hypothetical protein